MLTVIISQRTNTEKTIKSLEYIKPSQILVANLSKSTNHSYELNNLIEKAKNDWIFYIKDSEILCQGELILDSPKIYGCQILQEDIIIKEPRIWHKSINIKFKNPVFEKLNTDNYDLLDIIIYQENIPDSNSSIILDLWKKQSPLSVDLAYYKAFNSLGNKNYKEFKSYINHYLFTAKKDISYVI